MFNIYHNALVLSTIKAARLTVDLEESHTTKTRRIAVNTLMLYVRTFVTMLISLYTSRVILEIIGVDNFGIYNVVGGIVGFLSIISGSMVNAISRYLTFSLGKGNIEHLKRVFSTSILIQGSLSIVLILICETIGLWFLNYKLNIAAERMYAANWVFQFSIISSVLGLMVIPYNACIVSHEKMSIYAYLSIIEVTVKLLFIYMLYIMPGDKLILYAFALFLLSLLMQIINIIYCKRNFEECNFKWKLDTNLLREISTFAGWNFFGNAANVGCSQGINILLNIFFGVTVNAARAIVIQVELAIRRFTDNFMTAVNPQITISYSRGDINYMKRLMDLSSRFSFFLFLLIGLPIWTEAKMILEIWLVDVPADTVIFLRLSMIVTAIMILGNSSYTVMMSTGKIKKIQLYATVSGFLVLPVAWTLFKFGAPAYSCYILLILNYTYVVYIRVYLLQENIGTNILPWFISKTIMPVLIVLAVASIAPLTLNYLMPPTLARLFIVSLVSIITSSASIYLIGLYPSERTRIKNILINRLRFQS